MKASLTSDQNIVLFLGPLYLHKLRRWLSFWITSHCGSTICFVRQLVTFKMKGYLAAFVLVFALIGPICSEARRRLNGTRTNCAKFGTRNSTREVCIKQHGRSGKFSISVGRRSEDDPRTITLEFDRIRELDKDGNEIANTGPRSGKHSFKTFANLDFEYSDLMNTSYKGIDAYGFNFSVLIPGPNATLNVPIFIFKRDGTIDLCDNEETIIIKRGMVKYNIELSGWSFCSKEKTPCKKGNKEEIGEFAEFVMTVKYNGKAVQGKREKKKPGMKRKARKFFFGNKTISFPGAVVSDGACEEMPGDYPKLGKKGSKFSVYFRFPKFSSQVIYDPAVNVLDDETPPPEESDSASAQLVASLGVVMMLGFLARLFS